MTNVDNPKIIIASSDSSNCIECLQRTLTRSFLEVEDALNTRLTCNFETWQTLPESEKSYLMDYAQGFLAGWSEACWTDDWNDDYLNTEERD